MHSRTIVKKDFTYGAVVGGELPLGSAFGANFNDDPVCRSNLRRSHTLGSVAVEPAAGADPAKTHAPHTAYDFSAGMSFAATLSNTTSAQAYGARFRSQMRDADATLPPRVVDETVLRFLGYSIEQVLESPDETQRVRKLSLVFHCADETLLLREAAQINSGMTQGVVLKRQRVPTQFTDPLCSTHITAKDIPLDGVTPIDIFGRKLTIVDAAEATRAYLRDKLGLAVPAGPFGAWPTEVDTYNVRQAAKLKTSAKRQLTTEDFDNKRALESIAGSGTVSKHAPDHVRTAQQFLKNKIGQHLQFAAYWDDRKRISGDLRVVVIRYYLENDTVEVVERRLDNSGREGGNVILCRQRVPMPGKPSPLVGGGGMAGAAQQNTYGLLLKNDFLKFDDLRVGMELELYGCKYQLYDADSFTREWYQREHGLALAPRVDISDVERKYDKSAPMQYPPPHIGFGTEEDSLQSWKSLLLKPPKMNVEKLAKESGKTMLFRAEFALANPAPEDVGREFLITFHRATDEVEIVERQLRNAGIVGGKFLAKGRHLKVLPDGRKVPFQPSDFAVGAVVTIAGRSFKLNELDERSRKMAEGEEAEVSEDRVKQLIVALRELLNSKFARLHEAYRSLAPEGVLGKREIQDFFRKCSGDISDEEAVFVARYFVGDDGDGRVGFDRFIKMMDPGNTHSMDEAANSVRSIKGVKVAGRTSEEGVALIASLKEKQGAADRIVKQQQLKKALVGKLVTRRGTVQESFRLLAGHAPNARLTKDKLDEAMVHVLHMPLPPAEFDLLAEAMFDTPDRQARGVDFGAFYRFIESV